MEYKTDLSKFDNSWYEPGASRLKMMFWYLSNALVFRSYLFPSYSLKRKLLRLFGARIGKKVVVKPGVNIKYPWKLILGNHCWIGEGVWIDNLALVTIGNHAVVSQGALLLCGNHNYKKSSFDLLTGAITLEDGVWIGANATVCPGVICQSHSVLTVGSVATSNLEAFTIYQGNPALKARERALIG